MNSPADQAGMVSSALVSLFRSARYVSLFNLLLRSSLSAPLFLCSALFSIFHFPLSVPLFSLCSAFYLRFRPSLAASLFSFSSAFLSVFRSSFSLPRLCLCPTFPDGMLKNPRVGFQMPLLFPSIDHFDVTSCTRLVRCYNVRLFSNPLWPPGGFSLLPSLSSSSEGCQ
jgi:hypothetical protein